MERMFMGLSDDDETVKLDDGSEWELDAGDIPTAAVWLESTRVTMEEMDDGLYEMTNTSNEQTITVRRKT